MDLVLFAFVGLSLFLIWTCVKTVGKASAYGPSKCRNCNQLMDPNEREENDHFLCKSCNRKRIRLLETIKMQKKV